MAHFLAIMFATVQYFVANVVADKLLAAALDLALFFLAEALYWHVYIALVAFTLMTLPFALMLHAVQ